ncbi:MAG: dtnK 2 [Firmicutes bacterium]|nr:dtnK 2 [Bacillota bacterium]
MLKEITQSIVVIADDLTGANDTGVQFARHGLQTWVILEGAEFQTSSGATAIVIDTGSRAIPAQEAYRKVQAAVKQAYDAGFFHCYKKIDSTLRGNVGVELKAILDLGLHDFAFVMPAFPKNGRTTIGGNHLLHGLPLAATEIAHDPKCPVCETVLPKLLRQQSGLKVGHIGIDEICQGEEAIVKAIQQYLAEGCRIISCDAWLDEQFQMAARAATLISSRVLWSGSAGLADCLPQLLNLQAEVQNFKPILVVAGSVSLVTHRQIALLLDGGFELIEVRAADCFSNQNDCIQPYIQTAIGYMENGKNIVLASGYQSDAVQETQNTGSKLGMSSVEVGEAVAGILGRIGASILLQQEVACVVLTGGDTAAAVCRDLGVSGIQVIEELAPGIPLGEMRTTEGIVLKVITKAGAFGSPDVLLKIVKRIRRR